MFESEKINEKKSSRNLSKVWKKTRTGMYTRRNGNKTTLLR